MTMAGLKVERVEIGLLRGRVIATGEVTTPQGPAPGQLGRPDRPGGCAAAARRRRRPAHARQLRRLHLLGATAWISAAGIAALAVL